jgi:fermentation-respiration switch protein FrsA (DUF1100 family)
MREDITFSSHGVTCRGWFYRPDAATGTVPAIVMAHGFSAVMEQGLDGFARGFVDAGFAVLAYDHRFLGASDGAPRGRIVPHEQHDDARAALDWLTAEPGIDPSRIGIWGSSYSGGHALFLGAVEPRIKAVVAQTPAVAVARSLMALAGPEGYTAMLGMLAADHAARNRGEPGGEIAVVAPEGEPAVLGTPDSWAWFTGSDAPGWLNRTSLESVARMIEYDPGSLIALISPKPLLVIAGEADSLIPIAQVREAFACAGEPKRLIALPCGHFDVYPGGAFHTQARDAATAWFVEHLAG